MKVIGITGPTGAGKTTALNALQSLGAAVIDADAVYHELTVTSPELRQALTARFGGVYDLRGNLDRKKLGGILDKKCDVGVGVIAPEEVRVRRIMARENITEQYARMRVAAQKKEDFYRKNCTYLLENTENDTPEDFSLRAIALFREILQ
jgi:dephospho-CoA kinase